MPGDDLPVLGFGSAAEWESWLAEQHADSPGLWLKIPKKGSGAAGVSYADALSAALCYGWIDGQKGRLDDEHWLQRFTPRKPGGRWSRVNTDAAAALIEAGRMKPAGLREVEAARADGRWAASYEPQSTVTVPDDLARALDENQEAREFFAALDRANRYAILYRIADAKRPETRARRIATYVAMLGDHKKIHP
jgi:uncharacterized protein YdeI (YjbR/CyaY-like superfamily)